MLPDDDDTSGAYGPIQLFAAEYFSTALGMPFEVGKTLLQIEYRPRKRFDTTPDEAKVVFEVEEEEVSPYAGEIRLHYD
jgi:fusion and transport protein UGO1